MSWTKRYTQKALRGSKRYESKLIVPRRDLAHPAVLNFFASHGASCKDSAFFLIECVTQILGQIDSVLCYFAE